MRISESLKQKSVSLAAKRLALRSNGKVIYQVVNGYVERVYVDRK